MGTTITILIFIFWLLGRSNESLMYAPIFGYGFAWVGHFFFEKNKPATFENPIYSLFGDFYMWGQYVTGRLNL